MPSWSGSAAPSTLDDAGRALQGAVTREWNWRSYTLTAGGTADAKTLTYGVAPAAYYNGQRFAFIANTTNTGSATLNVNSLGAKVINKDVSGTLTNLSASDMVSGMFVEVAYNTANDCFVWVNRGIYAFPAGTAALPSITTTGDANTGFWFPAADTIAASTGGSERVRIDSSGNVLVGKTSAATTGAGIWAAGTGYLAVTRVGTTSQSHVQFVNDNGVVGSIITNGSATSYATSSDYRLKQNETPVFDPVGRFMQLKPISFEWKADGTRVDGFFAHELAEVVPEAVVGTKDAVDDDGNPIYQSIDQSKLVPLLTAALQEALTKIDALESRIAALEAA